jgi:hypothetical protein
MGIVFHRCHRTALGRFLLGACLINLGALPTQGASASASAADLVHLYEFNTDLRDSIGSVPLLGNGGSVANGWLQFGPNQGPTLRAEASLAASYSIGLRFSLDSLRTYDNYIKLVDFGNRTSDDGLYLKYDCLKSLAAPVFYRSWPPRQIAGSGEVLADTEVDLVLTRDAAHSRFTVYLDGEEALSFVDSSLKAVATVSANESLFEFFLDDLPSIAADCANGRGDAVAGRLDEIRVWDGPLTADQARKAFAPVPEPGVTALLAMLWLGWGARAVWRRRAHARNS